MTRAPKFSDARICVKTPHLSRKKRFLGALASRIFADFQGISSVPRVCRRRKLAGKLPSFTGAQTPSLTCREVPHSIRVKREGDVKPQLPSCRNDWLPLRSAGEWSPTYAANLLGPEIPCVL